MNTFTLNRDDYRDKVYACWLGKTIGGTLGAPHECKPYPMALTYYTPVPEKPLPNDDLDLQLIWLAMLEQYGPQVQLPHFAEYWSKYLYKWRINEYGFCGRNLERGLLPPASGWFENDFVDEMGSPIRSEIWACAAPGDPQRAASLAWMDSAMDHAGGEGMYGEMFWAAVQSAAFVIDDPHELVRIGLAMIPPATRVARAIREVIFCRKIGGSWGDWGSVRWHINRFFGHPNPCHAVQNIAYTVIGLLYGEDFGDRLLKAVNCGYDTDCTGATLGAALGIMHGTRGIPEEWSRPVGNEIILCGPTIDIGLPKTLEELTERTINVAERFAAVEGAVQFGPETHIPVHIEMLLERSEMARAALTQDLRAMRAIDGEFVINLHFATDPAVHDGVADMLQVSCRRNGQAVDGDATLQVPAGWLLMATAPNTFIITPHAVKDRNLLQVSVDIDGQSYGAQFTLLGPNEAYGFPIGETEANFCRKCTGRGGWCICPQEETGE